MCIRDSTSFDRSLDRSTTILKFDPYMVIFKFWDQCGGSRRTPNSKILFSLSLYIRVAIEFTWEPSKSWLLSCKSPLASAHQKHQRISSISASAASAHQQHQRISSISAPAAWAASAHQQHQCISSNSPSAASAYSQQHHFSSISASAASAVLVHQQYQQHQPY